MYEEQKKQIIETLGIEDLTMAEQDAVISDIGEMIMKQIWIDAYDKLSDDKKLMLKSVVEEGDFEKTLELLEDSIEDADALVANASKNVLDSIK